MEHNKTWISYKEWVLFEEFYGKWGKCTPLETENMKVEKPKIDIEEVRQLYDEDMKKSKQIDFKDYCKELEILFEIIYYDR